MLRAGDAVAVIGSRVTLVQLLAGSAEEVHDHELLEVAVATRDVVLSSPSVVGRSVAEIRAETVASRGVFLQSIRRSGLALPVEPGQRLEAGDILTLHGLAPAVDRIA